MYKQKATSFGGAGLLILAIALMVLAPRAAADLQQEQQEQQQQQQPGRILGDEVADSPLEMHQRHKAQHGPPTGHLPPSSKNVKLISKLRLGDPAIPGRISDVSGFRGFAYLGQYTAACPGGVHIVDIRRATTPERVGFIPARPGTYVSEGVQVLHISTRFFKGDLLVHNNEICDEGGLGGVSLWDVTDPRNPKSLAQNVGDVEGGLSDTTVNQIHSAFAWEVGDRAYVVLVDDEELLDVDILEITDPRNPVLIAETGLPDWEGAQTPLANGDTTFFHDVVVKKIRSHWYMLLSYWDAGWIILNVDDPANPVFVNDSNYPDPDSLTGLSPAEGNAHQAEWSHDNRFIIGTDEDFSPERFRNFEITTGPNAGPYTGGIFGFTVPLSTKFPGGVMAGPTIWGGSGCEEDLDGNGISDRAEVPPASSLPAEPGEARIVVFSRGVCFFSIKIESGQLAGYDAVIIGQSHTGSGLGANPDSFLCGGQGHEFDITAAGVCTGHRATHLLFNTTPQYTPGESATFPPGGDIPIGTLGERVRAEAQFDGWGYVRLLDARTLEEIDAYAVPEGLDPNFAFAFGDLSVHEVATDPSRELAYLSYYNAGLRVVKFGKNGLKEVGHFIDVGGNNFWGVEAYRPHDRDDDVLILASDRDFGLYIFRFTPPDDDREDDGDHDREKDRDRDEED